MNTELWIAFTGASALLALMPGPDNIYVLTESISKGWRHGVSITTGLISGVSIHTTLVATGLSVFVFQIPVVFNLLKIVGAVYLLFMAYQATREKAMTLMDVNVGSSEPFIKLFKKGFLMNVLNPKVSLFFVTLLPQFVSPSHASPWVQMMLLGATFMIVSFIIFSSIALFAGKASEALANDKFWTIMKWIKVMLLIALATLMLFANQ